jgi:hypothetical protein
MLLIRVFLHNQDPETTLAPPVAQSADLVPCVRGATGMSWVVLPLLSTTGVPNELLFPYFQIMQISIN